MTETDSEVGIKKLLREKQQPCKLQIKTFFLLVLSPINIGTLTYAAYWGVVV